MKLRDALQASSLTQGQIATMIGVSRPLVNQWVNAVCRPSQKALEKLKKILEVDEIEFSEPRKALYLIYGSSGELEMVTKDSTMGERITNKKVHKIYSGIPLTQFCQDVTVN